MHTNC
jgi:hypothetical protein